jgi:hypothetical protein
MLNSFWKVRIENRQWARQRADDKQQHSPPDDSPLASGSDASVSVWWSRVGREDRYDTRTGKANTTSITSACAGSGRYAGIANESP